MGSNSKIKKLSSLLLALVSFAMVMFGETGCKTSTTSERPQTFRVIGVSGNAHYRDGEGGKWRKLKLGDHLKQGFEVQTSDGPTNSVILEAGEHLMPSRRVSSPHTM